MSIVDTLKTELSTAEATAKARIVGEIVKLEGELSANRALACILVLIALAIGFAAGRFGH